MKAVQRRLGAAGLPAFAALMLVATVGAAPAQPAPPLKMYVMDCGTFKYTPAKGGLPGPVIDHSDPCFLIVHPKGTLLWETGWNDAEYDHPGPLPNGAIIKFTRSLKAQLAEIGYTPDKITYVAVSHYHADHSGNSNDYAAKSTWITQKDQRDAMFGPWPGVTPKPQPNMQEWDKLKSAKTIVIPNKDYDVFGDGSVVLLDTPASTPGHMSVFVNLPKTGPVLVGGDVYTDQIQRQILMQINGRRKGKPLPQSYIDNFRKNATPRYLASSNKVEDFLIAHKAQLWIQHDVVHFKTLKKSPAFYD